MKGMFVRQGYTITINVQGEQWHQGEQIKGHITLTPATIMPALYLAYNSFKNTLNKSTPTPLQEIPISPSPTGEWNTTLPIDTYVTDKAGSLYLLYGLKETPLSEYASLQLTVKEHPIITQFIEIFELFFRFKKGPFRYKEKSKTYEIKLTPPKTKDYGNIEQLLLSLTLDNKKDLHLNYTFTVTTLSLSKGETNVEKKKRTATQTLTSKEYELYAGSSSLNHDLLKTKIEEILAPIKTKVLF